MTWRKVRVTALSDDSATVTGDLRDGDQVVALGAQLLHDGEHVRLANDKMIAASVSAQGAAQ